MPALKEIHSKVNPDLLVTENQCVVSLARKKYHAYILIEGIVNNRYYLEWYDFIANYTPHTKSLGSLGMFFNVKAFLNRKVDAQVRYCPSHHQEPLKDITDKTKAEIFDQFDWSMDTDSWICSVEKVAAMKEDIEKDVQKHDEGKLKFKMCGHSAPNCTTWTWEKLKVAGIDAKNEDYLNKIIVIASHNVGSKRHP